MILDIDHVILVVHSAATVAGVVVLFHAVKTDGSANPVGAQVVPHKPLVTVIAALGLEVPSAPAATGVAAARRATATGSGAGRR